MREPCFKFDRKWPFSGLSDAQNWTFNWGALIKCWRTFQRKIRLHNTTNHGHDEDVILLQETHIRNHEDLCKRKKIPGFKLVAAIHCPTYEIAILIAKSIS